MKKLLAILTALLLVASVAYSLDSMKDTDMDGVTGQAGVSLTQYGGSITVTQTMQGLSWGDDDGCSTVGLNGTGAGHLAVHALTTGGGQGLMGMTIGLVGTIKLDVDAVGLYISMQAINVTVAQMERLQLAVSSGTVMNPAQVSNDTTTVLGDLCLDTAQVTVSMPSTLCLSPH